MKLSQFVWCRLLAAGAAYGQSTELTGRITDPQDQIVPGARVRIVRTTTQTVFETVSNESGYYVYPNLPSGTYQISVAREGFKTAERSGITVATADKRRLDIRLELGAVSETVSVTADASVLEVSSASVTTTVNSRDSRHWGCYGLGREGARSRESLRWRCCGAGGLTAPRRRH